MRILFTGASSATGRHVLRRILDSGEAVEMWCVRHTGDVATSDSRVHVIDLDLTKHIDSASLPEAIDLVIHFAGLTHARDPESYWEVNLRGTGRLAEAARTRGARRFVYISTRCATPDAGDYGKSKLATENELKKLDWDSLLIIRPSEIYGAGGKEGVDRLIALAQRWRLTPLLFGKPNINFAPLAFDDFAAIVVEEIVKPSKGLRIVELCGPEDLNATALAKRIARRYKALPIPIWWPLFAVFLKIATAFKLNFAVPDQLQRLSCVKTGSAERADRTGRVRFMLDQ